MGSFLSTLRFLDLASRLWTAIRSLHGLWQTIKDNKLQTVLAILGIVGIGLLLIWALRPQLAPLWTGFGPELPTTAFNRGKTLWDWFELLLVPAAIILAAWWIRRERTLSTPESLGPVSTTGGVKTKDQDSRLQSFLDTLSLLLLKEGLRDSSRDDEVRKVARARLASTLWGLDGPHKGALLRFLHESGLIRSPNPIIPLAGVDLSGADLRDIALEKADLRFAQLNQVKMSGAKLQMADLTGADLTEGDMRDSCVGAAADSRELPSPIMRQARLDRADMTRLDLSGTDLTQASLKGARMEDADLRGSLLRETDLQGAVLRRAYLEQTNLKEGNLRSANLREARLDGVILSGASLNEADLRRASVVRANLRLADLDKANLRGADLTQAFLFEAHLRGADLRGSTLRGANLNGADLTDAKMKGADLRGAFLSDAIVTDAQLKSAKSLVAAVLPVEHAHLAPTAPAGLTGSNSPYQTQIAANDSSS